MRVATEICKECPIRNTFRQQMSSHNSALNEQSFSVFYIWHRQKHPATRDDAVFCSNKYFAYLLSRLAVATNKKF